MKSIVNYKRIGDKPFLIMMCGLPGSGKSTFAENSITVTSGARQYKPVIHSSDGLRKEIYGNESTQGDANKVFGELHKRIKNDRKQSGCPTVYLHHSFRSYRDSRNRCIPCQSRASDRSSALAATA